MKKTVLVFSLAAAMLFAFASVAMAGGYVGYSAAAGATDSPHMGYAATTTKCEVCHAVHEATAGNDLLFGGSLDAVAFTGATPACAYCHMTTTGGYVQVYTDAADAPQAALYEASNPFGHDKPEYANCNNCHSVHGAQTLTTGGASAFILKDYDLVESGAGLPADGRHHLANAPVAWKTSASHDEQITWFCTQCHGYYTDGVNGAVASNDTNENLTAPTVMGGYSGTGDAGRLVANASHPMVAKDTFFGATGTGAAARGASIGAISVAWTDATYCRSCHSAGTDAADVVIDGTRQIGGQFPHSTPGAAMFLPGQAGYAVTNSLGGSTYTISGSHASDGVCLNCHRSGAVAGVGITF